MISAAPGPDVGVVVVSYNTRDLLRACLASAEREVAANSLNADIHVVDNASADGSVEMVKAEYPAARLTASPDNRGYASAVNLALRQWLAGPASPAAVLVLNADVELLPGSLAEMRRVLLDTAAHDGLRKRGNPDQRRHAPRIAVVGPSLQYLDGRFQHGAFRDPGLVQTLLDLFPVARLTDSWLNGRYGRRLYASGKPFRVDFPLGACLLVSVPAVAAVGPMDEDYFMYCEEIDWCRRFRAAGYEVLCAPRALVLHHSGASTTQWRADMWVALWRSRLRMFALHEPPARFRLLTTAVRLGMHARLVSDAVAVRRGLLAPADLAARRAAVRRVLA